MKKNLKLILFLIICIVALYLTKIGYGDYSKNKSIAACMIAIKKSNKELNKEQAEKICIDEVNKKINK